jgi:hypothetical protein
MVSLQLGVLLMHYLFSYVAVLIEDDLIEVVLGFVVLSSLNASELFPLPFRLLHPLGGILMQNTSSRRVYNIFLVIPFLCRRCWQLTSEDGDYFLIEITILLTLGLKLGQSQLPISFL